MISALVIFTICFVGNARFGAAQPTDFSCAVRPSQADTTAKLQRLRAQLTINNLHAYVSFAGDEHQSEYVQPYDERRAWISGFVGSAGTAVVTRDRAALWTDGRYWTQAEDELDCKHWLLMRSGRAGVPSLINWLASQANGTVPYNRIGVAAQFVSSSWWSSASGVLALKNASLVEVAELIDLIWTPPERPLSASNQVFVHDLRFTGVTWQDKVKIRLRRWPS